jgi:hypothetical protein
VDPRDWHPDTTAEQIVSRCAAAGPGDIVLLHDGLEAPLAPPALDRSRTLVALPQVIAGIRQRGLGFGAPSLC